MENQNSQVTNNIVITDNEGIIVKGITDTINLSESNKNKNIWAKDVESAMRLFLNCDGIHEFCLDPPVLNPFLRCLESMGKSVNAELQYTGSHEHKPYYRISRSIINPFIKNYGSIKKESILMYFIDCYTSDVGISIRINKFNCQEGKYLGMYQRSGYEAKKLKELAKSLLRTICAENPDKIIIDKTGISRAFYDFIIGLINDCKSVNIDEFGNLTYIHE